MKTPFRYPGAKTKLLHIISPKIQKYIHKDSIFHDVFVGGGSVLIAVAEQNRSLFLSVNDLDPLIYNFWSLIAYGNRSNDKEMIDLIHSPISVKKFIELKNSQPKTMVESAYRAIFFNRTTFSGIQMSNPIGGFNQNSNWKIDCRYNAKKIIEKYRQLIKLLRGRLNVECLDCIDYLSYNDAYSDVYYLDPPYYEKGNVLYPVKMSVEQHLALSKTLINMKHWVLSYDNNDKIFSMYNWANIENINARYSINGKKSNWSNKTELLITRK